MDHTALSAFGADSAALRHLIAAIPDGVVVVDADGTICATNQAWQHASKLMGANPAISRVGENYRQLYQIAWGVGSELASQIDAGISRVLADAEEYRVEVPFDCEEGKIWFSVVGRPFEIEGMRFALILHRDVTAQHREPQRLQDILDNLFAFVGVLELDGTLVEANRAPLQAAGLKPEDVLGKKFWDCYWWNYSPKVQLRLQQAHKRALAGELVRYDVEVRIAGGALIWLDFQLAPLLDADGKIVNLIPSGIDISERRAATDALRTSRDTFRNLVERSPFGVYTVDSDFRLAHVSDGAQAAFANVHPLKGHDLSDALRTLWPETFASEAIGRFRHTLTTGEPYRSPRTVERRQDSGEVESYDWMIERITMPDGRAGVVCNFYDLSERQRHEEHIRMLMREVNHRAKNLLTVVISMARQTAQDGSPRDFVERFTHRLLGLSASQDLIVEGNWSGVTVGDLVRSQLKHLGQQVNHNRVVIEGPDILLTPAAAQGIGMALHELSTNAIKHGSLSVPDGTVTIAWDKSPDDETFYIRWSEHGGPSVSPPVKSGFGRTVIEKMAAISVGGEVDLEYAQTGLLWRLTAPSAQVEKRPDA